MAEIIGKISTILEKTTGVSKTGNEWVKQEFVLETDGNYPKKVCFNVWGDKIDQVVSLATGSTIKVFFDPESREYNNKWYTDLKVWKIEAANASSGQQNEGMTSNSDANQSFKKESVSEEDPFANSGGDDDDLPF